MIASLLPGQEVPQDAQDAAMLATARRITDRFLLARLCQREAMAHSGFYTHAMAGDRARDGRRWQQGFENYRAALDIFPFSAVYMVQAGHCLKEAGRLMEAEGYYRSALLLGALPQDVVEHLVFTAQRNRYPETEARMVGLAEAVAAEAPYVAELPSLDDIVAVAAFWRLEQGAVMQVALDCLREATPYPNMAARILALGPAPAWIGGAMNGADVSAYSLTPAPPPPAPSLLDRILGRRRAALKPPAQVAPAALSSSLAPMPTPFPVAATAEPMPPPLPPVDWAALFAAEAAALAPGGAGLTTSAVFHAAVTPVETAAQPVISIIVPAGAEAWLSLASVASSCSRHQLELILVGADDHLAPANIQSVTCADASWAGVCNTGAAAARGAMLLFLAPGAALGVGALDALFDALEDDPETGLAGPVQALPDGTLLETGGFIRPDGAVARRAFGKGDFDLRQLPPQDPVDTLPPEALMISARDFAALGGFDAGLEEHGGPALLATELALRLRARGRYTILVPHAVCYRPGPSAPLQPAGAAALVERWGEFLGSRVAPLPEATALPCRIGADLGGSMNTLHFDIPLSRDTYANGECR